jgi:hypothetical protein
MRSKFGCCDKRGMHLHSEHVFMIGAVLGVLLMAAVLIYGFLSTN